MVPFTRWLILICVCLAGRVAIVSAFCSAWAWMTLAPARTAVRAVLRTLPPSAANSFSNWSPPSTFATTRKFSATYDLAAQQLRFVLPVVVDDGQDIEQPAVPTHAHGRLQPEPVTDRHRVRAQRRGLLLLNRLGAAARFDHGPHGREGRPGEHFPRE